MGDRRRRSAAPATGHPRRPPVRLPDHPVRQGPRSLPRCRRQPNASGALEHPRPGGRWRPRPARLRRVRPHRGRDRRSGAPVVSHARREGGPAVTDSETYAAVRYIVDDVQAAVEFYTTHLGFRLRTNPAPAFADVVRGPLRLLLSGPASSGARSTPADAATAGRNRIHLIVDDLDAEIARLRGAHLSFRSAVVRGPGGRKILLADPDGNLIELFQAVHRPDAAAAAAP